MPAWQTRGQAAARAAVARAVATERPAHAWLLVGPAGVGKTTAALDLARGLLCLATDPLDRPCGACLACRKVAHGNHPDVHRLVPEGAGRQIRIGHPIDPDPGTVRRLVRDLSLTPAEGRFRVAIVEDASRMNEDAQNALLKMLEEPPPATCLILCAVEEDALLPTVRSRSSRVRLGPVPAEELAAILVEHGLADPMRSAYLARRAEGRPGRAMALAREPEAVHLQDRLARQLLDLADADRRTRLGSASGLLADAERLAQLLDRAEAVAGEETPGDLSREPGADSRQPRGAAAASPEADQFDGTSAVETDADEEPEPEPGRRQRSSPPAARRQALLALAALWAVVARDVAVAGRGGRAELRQIELLEEFVALSERLPAGAAEAFLERLELTASAIEQNANPDLALDTLLLAWPQARSAA